MKRFTQNNQAFECIHCGSWVFEHPTSSRDHCNFCLYGSHVDINPGDRQNNCKGLLMPIGYQKKTQKEQIVYRCLKCEKKLVNIIAPDDDCERVIALASQGVSID